LSDTAQSLTRLLITHRPASDHRGYPLWLRRRVATFVRSSSARGVKLAMLCRKLGVSTTTLRRWAAMSDTRFGAGFVPVAGNDASATTDATYELGGARPTPLPTQPRPSSTDSELRLLSPSGFASYGLSLEQALVAMKALR
jgi:hypothetical protein